MELPLRFGFIKKVDADGETFPTGLVSCKLSRYLGYLLEQVKHEVVAVLLFKKMSERDARGRACVHRAKLLMKHVSPFASAFTTALKLAYNSYEKVHGNFIIVIFIDLYIFPQTVHVSSEFTASRQGLQQRVHVARVGHVWQSHGVGVQTCF